MKKLEVEGFLANTNAAIIRLPGRKFPGVLVQGDSLKIMVDAIEDIARLAKRGASDELFESTAELESILKGYKRVYEDVLKAHGEPLPYEKNPRGNLEENMGTDGTLH